MQPKFFYFDLGKVLVNFSIDQMLRQVGEVTGIGPEEVRAAVFRDGLMQDYESGRLSTQEFHAAYCKATGRNPELNALARAASEIFEWNPPMLGLVSQLRQAGHRLGVLSNTCEVHWDYCVRSFPILTEGFDIHALSFRIGTMKPDAAIYRAAAALAGVEHNEIFFCDDLAENVAGACEAGFDAVQFTNAPALIEHLRQRGVQLSV